MPVRVDAVACTPTLSAGPVPPAPPIPRPLREPVGTPAERAAIHRDNLSRRAADARDYAVYAERFADAHARITSVAEADAFQAHFVPPPEFLPPRSTERQALDYVDGPNGAGVYAMRRSAERMANHRLALRDLKPPLTVELAAAFVAEVHAGKARYAVELSVGPGGFAAEVAAGARPAKVVANTAGAVCAEYGFGMGTATVCGGTLDRLELEPTPLAPAGPLLATDTESVTIGVRAGKKLVRPRAAEAAPRWNVSLEGRATARLQLLSPDTVQYPLSRPPRPPPCPEAAPASTAPPVPPRG